MNDYDKAREAEVLAQELLRFADTLRGRAPAAAEPAEAPAADKPRGLGWRGLSHVELARTIYQHRKARAKFLPGDLLGEPAWDILLDLYVAQVERREINVTSASLASQVPSTTGLRWIVILESRGYIERCSSGHDARVTYLRLTDQGMSQMRCYLRSMAGEEVSAPHKFLLRAK